MSPATLADVSVPDWDVVRLWCRFLDTPFPLARAVWESERGDAEKYRWGMTIEASETKVLFAPEDRNMASALKQIRMYELEFILAQPDILEDYAKIGGEKRMSKIISRYPTRFISFLAGKWPRKQDRKDWRKHVTWWYWKTLAEEKHGRH